MRRVLHTLLLAAVAALVFAHAGTAQAAGGSYRFDGGTAAQRTQVREALKASSFNWNLVKAQITIHIQHGIDSHSVALRGRFGPGARRPGLRTVHLRLALGPLAVARPPNGGQGRGLYEVVTSEPTS
jgi:opacity protein-like surface antigen